MAGQYSSSKICPYKKSGCKDDEKLALEPGQNHPSRINHLSMLPKLIRFWRLIELTNILATSTDYD